MREERSETVFSEHEKRLPGGLFPLAGLVLGLLLLCGPAFSQSTEKRESYEIYMTAARKLYAAGLYRDAIEQFQKAYDSFPDPKIYFNMAQSHRMLNEDSVALDYYEKFLAAIPTIDEFSSSQKKAFTKEVRLKIVEMKNRLHPGSNPEAVDNGPVAPVGDSKLVVRVDAPTRGDEPTTVEGPGKLTSRWWFWTGVGVTALLTAGTVWGGVQALSANDEWEKTRKVDDRDRAMRYQDLTDLCLAGAVTGAVAVTVASVIWKKRQGERAAGAGARVRIVPGPGAESWFLTLSWEF
ncbi:tetratricopeptide repeat protein [Myxococcota bacterium]|nr:tetratricopeptide repeat protein [Myxococcota bacterium]MBU1413124.1 tetratricopeptide repeat protein [Myxococcota bacterium]MBU1512359.1 tetratricopeptide repeat protein [Myxococcota bacterium]